MKQAFSIKDLEEILKLYGIGSNATVMDFGNGLINHTWKVCLPSGDYILQKINEDVFKQPLSIENNIKKIGSWLQKNHSAYLFIHPVETSDGRQMVSHAQSGYFRLFPFVKNSVTRLVAATPGEAYEAARQFGMFTRMLHEFPAEQLEITLPRFHDLGLRQEQFDEACRSGNRERIIKATDIITALRSHTNITDTSRRLVVMDDFKQRVTHHDTKISNVLFDAEGKGITVIDLDTVMPGYFISDLGDMLRTYLSPVSEEEKDLAQVRVRPEFFKAVMMGYLEQMGPVLTKTEWKHLLYAGQFMIYMQALRFLADYLYDDRYYGARYEDHNLVRAKNQLALLESLRDNEPELRDILFEISGFGGN